MLSKNINNKKCAPKLIFPILYPPFENYTNRMTITAKKVSGRFQRRKSVRFWRTARDVRKLPDIFVRRAGNLPEITILMQNLPDT